MESSNPLRISLSLVSRRGKRWIRLRPVMMVNVKEVMMVMESLTVDGCGGATTENMEVTMLRVLRAVLIYH